MIHRPTIATTICVMYIHTAPQRTAGLAERLRPLEAVIRPRRNSCELSATTPRRFYTIRQSARIGISKEKKTLETVSLRIFSVTSLQKKFSQARRLKGMTLVR